MDIRGGTNYFRENADVRLPRSRFDRSHRHKMTFNASYLYPCYLDLIYPGDTFNMRAEGVIRVFSPLDAPLMDDIEWEIFYFFIPMRLLWSNWQYFMGEHAEAGAQDTTYTIPKLNTGMTVTHVAGTGDEHLAAYFGLPHGLQSANVTVSALPFRAYNLVWSEWFRDQNVSANAYKSTGDGPDTVSNYGLLKSGKKQDYFTSSLPDLQKGDAQAAALTGTLDVLTGAATSENISVYSVPQSAYRLLDRDGVSYVDISADADADGSEKLYINLANASVDINDLREAVAIQRYLERRARGGTRYVEMIKAVFGVTSPDFRLQRPEYLGGGRGYINVSAVANTSAVASAAHPASEDEYAGQLRGIGAGRVRASFQKSFTEHGYVMGLIRARGELTYFQGLERHWSYDTEFDFYVPDFANLGEQPIYNRELYVSNTPATDDDVFSYQERWSEMRFKKSLLVGLFNPDATGNIAHWHLAEDFSTTPVYNTSFIYDNTPMSRVRTLTTGPDFQLDMYNKLLCARVLPAYSIPSLTSRF